MAKTAEELNALRKEYESLKQKLKELTDEELKELYGGLKGSEQKYRFTTNDIVYFSENKELYNKVLETIDVDGEWDTVMCECHLIAGNKSAFFNSEVPALELLHNYKLYGGHFENMQLQMIKKVRIQFLTFLIS